MEENKKPSNPRMSHPDGMYASEARSEDFFSLRDYFAGKAMATLLNQKHYDGHQLYELNESRFIINHYDSEVSEEEKIRAFESVIEQAEFVAKRAYIMADAMLMQRES